MLNGVIWDTVCSRFLFVVVVFSVFCCCCCCFFVCCFSFFFLPFLHLTLQIVMMPCTSFPVVGVETTLWGWTSWKKETV